jgi:DNA-binding response OmpR family regulator
VIRLLLVEDDRLIGEMIRLNLKQQGYEVIWLRDGAAGEQRLLEAADSEPFDLAVLDVMLPGRTGFDISRRARDAGLGLPILMLTARSDTSSKVTGLDAGADDYLTKPFDVPELLARVRALLRRAGAALEEAPSRTLSLGPLQVNLDSGEATTRQGPQTLAPAPRVLLDLLARRRGQDLTIAEIIEELTSAPAEGAAPGAGAAPDPAALGLDTEAGVRDVVEQLRELFEPDVERPRHFLPVTGGYRFEG